jgi:Na+/H+-dicarboxylate symporter/ABC-type amino acid transport substrate-binding protein
MSAAMPEPNEESTTVGRSASPKPKHMSRLVWWTLASVALGVGCGLFLGDYCAPLKVVGDVFVGLLQMTVLPYVAVSLVAGIGKLDLQKAKRLAGTGVAILGLLWGAGIVTILLLILSFPERTEGAFYSSSLVATPESVGFFEMFVPANPFHALVDNLVPAVVVFSIFLGVALVAVPGKEKLIEPLDVLSHALIAANRTVVKLTPIGVFAITAEIAGTMTFDELGRLQAYLVVYLVAVVILTFWVLPMLLTVCTPLRYRDVLGATSEPLITALATGKTIVVLPMLIDETRLLLEERGMRASDAAQTDALYPLVYPFPNLERFVALLFVPFVAWFLDTPFTVLDAAQLGVSAPVCGFANPVVSIPFMLDSFHLPSDTFRMFLVANLYLSRVAKLLGVMHLFAFTVLSSAVLFGMFQINWRRLRSCLVLTIGLFLITIAGTGVCLTYLTAPAQDRENVLANMHSLMYGTDAVVHRELLELPAASPLDETPLQRIARTGVLRVGYLPDNLPYSFFNASGELVGFDIDMAYLLAHDQGWKLEFVPFEVETLTQQLDRGDFDVAMSTTVITPQELVSMRFSWPHTELAGAFVVQDYERSRFVRLAALRQRKSLSIAVLADRGESMLKDLLPDAEVIRLGSAREFFESKRHSADALAISAQAGAAWTLVHPDYAVVVPRDGMPTFAAGYPVAQRDSQFAETLSGWIEMKKDTKEYDEIYDHWILGRDVRGQERRWCVIRDVLHWVE